MAKPAVKTGRVKGFRRVLLPTALTSASDNAFTYALGLARRFRAKLYVIHVVDTGHDAAGFYVPHLSFEKLHGELREGAEAALRRFSSKRLRGYKLSETAVLEGEPYKQIVKFANDNKIDLVVMGSFGRVGVDRFIFGSTTERVMRKVKCPVMVVPPAV
jgi:nucleotide-binding universal stress UspA family protein